MNSTARTGWRAVLYFKFLPIPDDFLYQSIWRWLEPLWARPRRAWTNRRLRRRSWSMAARGFDLGWLRWLLSFCMLVALTEFFPLHPVLIWTALAANAAFGLLLSLYLGHLLFRRLQCSLLEWSMLILVLGNGVGLLFSSFTGMPLWLSLVPLIVAWALYGAVLGLVQAEILGLKRSHARVCLMLAGWLSSASPAFLIVGACLWYSQDQKNLVSAHMALWIMPLLGTGLSGFIADIYLTYKSRRAARAMVDEPATSPTGSRR